MLPHSPLFFPRPGQCVKACAVITGGHFCSLPASSHLIKRAQEMSLLADWPCVFLRRPPSGTADMHAASPSGGAWGPTSLIIPLMARLTSSSLLSSFPSTPVYSTTSLFPRRGAIAPNVHFHFHAASSRRRNCTSCPPFNSLSYSCSSPVPIYRAP